MADLQMMTIDELDAHSVELKGQIETIRDQRRTAKAVRDEKVIRQALEQRLSRPGKPVSVAHIDIETVRDLYGIARESPPGESNVVVTPPPGRLDGAPGKPEVQ